MEWLHQGCDDYVVLFCFDSETPPALELQFLLPQIILEFVEPRKKRRGFEAVRRAEKR